MIQTRSTPAGTTRFVAECCWNTFTNCTTITGGRAWLSRHLHSPPMKAQLWTLFGRNMKAIDTARR
jgi:hypothetical protein